MATKRTKVLTGTVPYIGMTYSYHMVVNSDELLVGNIDGYRIITILVTNLLTKEKVINFQMGTWKQWPSSKYLKLWHIITKSYKIPDPVND